MREWFDWLAPAMKVFVRQEGFGIVCSCFSRVLCDRAVCVLADFVVVGLLVRVGRRRGGLSGGVGLLFGRAIGMVDDLSHHILCWAHKMFWV
jgi:hypothetical protein